MKKNNKKGFTLAELLIVVAIIAVLVAVAIPVFTAQLEKSRESTDLANLRAAFAAASSAYLNGDDVNGKYFNTGTGLIDDTGNAVGKGTATVGNAANAVTIGGFAYAPNTAYTNNKIQITVTDTTITVAFVA